MSQNKGNAQPVITANTPAAAEVGPEPGKLGMEGACDAVAGWAAQGLRVAQRGLVASACWLDARAKTVGDLASTLACRPRADAPTDPQGA